ncbi:MAG: sodium:solute symporter family protein [Candidatus Nanoarchaeia archaeon]
MIVWLSLVFFCLYIAIVIGIGIFASRKESEEGFMIADRGVHGFQLAATMSAGFFDGATLSIFIAYVFGYGLSALWLFVGLALGFLLLKFFAPRIKAKADELKVYTMPEYFFHVFGKKNGMLFSFILILQFFGLLIVNLIVSGKVLTHVFGISYFLAVAIGGLIVLCYLLLAGFKAVVRTDHFQLFIMFLMSIGVGIFLFKGTSFTSVELNVTRLGLGNIIGFLCIGAFSVVVAPDLWQRIFAAKDTVQLNRGLKIAAFILLILGICVSVVGLATKQAFPNIVAEEAFVVGFSELLPSIVKELGLVLLYAVTLSSSDTITFVISSIFTRDLKNYTFRFSESSMKKLTRFFMILILCSGVAISVFYKDIITLGFSLGSLSLGLFPVVVGSFYWKLKKKAVMLSLVVSLLGVVVLFGTGQLNPATSVVTLPLSSITLFISQRMIKSD